jgi:uncharacterized membrane protein required for colicin V production
MKFDSLPINWFDLVLLIWLAMGIFRGRKRGMSAEMMTVINWITIVAVCSVFYAPAGEWLAQLTKFGLLFCYLIAYLVIAGLVSLVFVLGKRVLGGKLIGSDAFGKGEYYLAMPAGLLRFLCIMIAMLAILNARLYTQQELQADVKYQEKEYGKQYFPGLGVLQANVFEKSLSGSLIKRYLSFLLIKPTAPGGGKEYKQQEWKAPV